MFATKIHIIFICIGCLLTLPYVSSFIGEIIFEQKIAMYSYDKNGSNALV